MTVKECYEMFGGDYAGVFSRLRKDERIAKFALKFLNDTSFQLLKTSMAEHNHEEAFRAAHTLKGVSQNLGFENLYTCSSELTERLRNGQDDTTADLLAQVETEYNRTIAALQNLKV